MVSSHWRDDKMVSSHCRDDKVSAHTAGTRRSPPTSNCRDDKTACLSVLLSGQLESKTWDRLLVRPFQLLYLFNYRETNSCNNTAPRYEWVNHLFVENCSLESKIYINITPQHFSQTWPSISVIVINCHPAYRPCRLVSLITPDQCLCLTLLRVYLHRK